MRLVNYLIVFGMLAAVSFIIWRYMKNTDVNLEDEEDDLIKSEHFTVKALREITARNMNAFLKQDFTNQNLSKKEFERKNAAKARLRQALKEAAYGNREAKSIIMEYVRNTITTNNDLRVTEENINDFIPFEDTEELSAQDKFFIILQGYKREYGSENLKTFFKQFKWLKETEITSEMVNKAYDILLDAGECAERGLDKGIVDLTYEDKLDYLTQKVFEGYKGFGSADVLFETDIDEIDGGLSGLPFGSFELSNEFLKKAKYSYEAIWIMMSGRNIHLSCISFGTQEELVRVCNNVYKYNAQKVFSRSGGYVVSSMKNGSRVVVVRNPLADKYGFFVRKFDSAPSVEPEVLIKGEGSEIPRTLCEWFVKGQRNIAITGQQGTGKTTMLKSFIKWIDNLNIRTQELAFELHLSFAYPEKNIMSFQETDTVSAQEGLNLQKKTNGAVNIVGEVASAEQASHIIQTANVASLFAMFTHHAKTTAALVEMIALNLLQEGLYKEKRDAIEISAETLNIDVHLINNKGHRYIERICEVIPVKDQAYPSEIMQEKYESEHPGEIAPYTEEMARLDSREYYKRCTDRRLFVVNEICRWVGDPETGHYEFVNRPSEEMLKEIHARLLDPKDDETFTKALENIYELDTQIKKSHGQTNFIA